MIMMMLACIDWLFHSDHLENRFYGRHGNENNAHRRWKRRHPTADHHQWSHSINCGKSIGSLRKDGSVINAFQEHKVPIEEIRKLYNNPANMNTLPGSRKDDIATSEEESSDEEEDSGYQRLLIAENSTLSKDTSLQWWSILVYAGSLSRWKRRGRRCRWIFFHILLAKSKSNEMYKREVALNHHCSH